MHVSNIVIFVKVKGVKQSFLLFVSLCQRALDFDFKTETILTLQVHCKFYSLFFKLINLQHKNFVMLCKIMLHPFEQMKCNKALKITAIAERI